ncbi:tyrosine-protein phosphatase [Rathayibacter sp. CAU 1779]
MSDQQPGSLLPAEGIPNLRDVGGYTTVDGRTVRRGLVYRSTALDHATDADVQLLADHGIRSVIDLRTAAEREARPDRLPAGVETLDLDVFADSPGATPARIAKLSSEPEKATRLLARADVDAVFAQAYRGPVSLPSALEAYRELFLTLSRSDALPALYHCTTGKDRTGWATAALLLLLGVPEQTVVDDYVLSNDYLLASLKPVLDAFAARGGDPEKLKPVLGVKAQYLLTAFEELREKYGTIERYFADGLGLDGDAQQRLKDVFLE